MAMHGKSSKHHIPRDHIRWSHLIEHSPGILEAPTFEIHVNEAITHKDIRVATSLDDLLVHMSIHFKCHYTGTCIQDPHKSESVWLHSFVLHLLKQLQSLLPLATFHMAHNQSSPWDHILFGHLVKHSQSIHHAPTLGIHVNKAITHTGIRLATTLNDLHMNTPALFKGQYTGTCILDPAKVTTSGSIPPDCISLNSSNALCPCPHFTCPNITAFHATTSGFSPSHCICWNSSIAFCPCPQFTCPGIKEVQETTLCIGISLNTLQASSTFPHLAYMLMRLLPTKTSDS